MSKARNGKIAHLPLTLRTDLNHRMDNGVPGHELIAWLNADPEVQHILTQYFQSRLITQQNLSDWRNGGYQDWIKLQETCHLTLQHAKESGTPDTDLNFRKIINALAHITTTEFFHAGQKRLRECEDTDERWKHVCAMSDHLSRLRRHQHREMENSLRQEQQAYKIATEQRTVKIAAEAEARRQVLASLLPKLPKPSNPPGSFVPACMPPPTIDHPASGNVHPVSDSQHPASCSRSSAPHQTAMKPSHDQIKVENAHFPGGTCRNVPKKSFILAGGADRVSPIDPPIRPSINPPSTVSLTLAHPASMHLVKPTSTLFLPTNYRQKPSEKPAFSK